MTANATIKANVGIEVLCVFIFRSNIFVGQGEPRVAKRSVFVINIRGGAILGWIQILELIYINHSRIPALLAKHQFFYTYLLEEKIIQPTDLHLEPQSFHHLEFDRSS